MHFIQSVEARGLRGHDKTVSFSLDPHVNFLIGRNGSGKTTLINAINATLSVDIQAIIESPFDYLKIKFRKKGDNRRPFIEINRNVEPVSKTVTIKYSIRLSSTSDASDYYFSSEQAASSLSTMARLQSIYLPSVDPFKQAALALQARIAEITNVTWLSVHRAAIARGLGNEEAFASPVDKRLNQVARGFAVYFSELDKMSADETNRFQQTYFLSLLRAPSYSSSNFADLSVEQQMIDIATIFQEFGLEASVYKSNLELFRKRVDAAKNAFKPGESITPNNFMSLIDSFRINSLTAAWRRSISKRNRIYRPKDEFIEIVNSLFRKKFLSITPGNEPEFSLPDGQYLPLMGLSSGEKQMFIILGEALIQRQKEWIFLADEPELSLHIDWQMKLVPNPRAINPSAQIIFATHSPDIVGPYQDKVVNLEDFA